jgi:iron complex outermembrane recepter protein
MRRARLQLIGCQTLSMLLGGLSASGAWAQTSPDTSSSAAAAANPGELQEVVVTAERRSSTVQSAPLSITAYTGAQLQAEGITDIGEVGYETPGISEKNSGPGQTEYEMRGISSSGGTSPTVGFYLDDVPLTAPAEGLEGKVVIDPSLYDLNRVEVLRGPQGTLYGSGSMGGTIRLITNQPELNTTAASADLRGSGTQGGGGNYAANLMANLPVVTDTVALRIVGTYSYTSGWIDRIVENPFPQETDGGFTRGNVLSAPVESVHTDTNWERLEGVRASLLWTPAENLTITPMAFYQGITQGGPNYVDVPPGIDYEAHYQPFDVNEPYSDNFELFSLPIKYSLPGVDINSISAYYKRNTALTQDSSEVGQDFLEALIGVPDVSYAEAGPLTAFENDHTSQYSQEIRLSSTYQGPFQWVVGGFYENYVARTGIGTTTPGPIVAETFGVPSYFFLTFKNTLDQYAGFGEASYQLDAFRLTAGVRYYSYSGKVDEVEGGGLISGPAAPLAYTLPTGNSGANPKLNLSYEPSKDVTLYAQAAKGFRPGGANTPPPVTCPNNALSYGPDDVYSFEAGEKLRLDDNRFTVNSAGYFENWKGIQQLITETCGATYTANAGTAHVYGAEIEANLAMTSDLVISNGLAYTHATIASIESGTGFSVGDRVQSVPDWTNTTAITYTHEVASDYELVLRATNVYTGTSTEPYFYGVDRIPVRDIVNVRAGLSSRSHISVFLFADNLGNKHANLGVPEELFSFVPSINRVTTNQPRTIGAELSYAFTGK